MTGPGVCIHYELEIYHPAIDEWTLVSPFERWDDAVRHARRIPSDRKWRLLGVNERREIFRESGVYPEAVGA